MADETPCVHGIALSEPCKYCSEADLSEAKTLVPGQDPDTEPPTESFADSAHWTTRGVQPIAVRLDASEALPIALAGGAVHKVGMFPTEYIVGRNDPGVPRRTRLFRCRCDKPEDHEISDAIFADGEWIEVTGPAALGKMTFAALMSRATSKENHLLEDENEKVTLATLERASAEIRDAYSKMIFSIERLGELARRAEAKNYPHRRDEDGAPVVLPPPVVLHAHSGSCDIQVFDFAGEENGLPQIVCLGCELERGQNVIFVGKGETESGRWAGFAAHMAEHLRVLQGEAG